MKRVTTFYALENEELTLLWNSFYGGSEYNDKDFIIENGALKKYTGHSENVVIPPNVRKICYCAFDECEELVTVYIPDTVEETDHLIFRNCPALRKITFETDRTIRKNCQHLRYKDKLSSDCHNLEEYEIISGTEYVTVNGIIFSKDSEVLIRYPEGKKDELYEIPEKVCGIADGSFFGCLYLTQVHINENVYKMENRYHKQVNPFIGCERLTDITVEKNNKHFYSDNGVLMDRDGTLVSYPSGRPDSEYSIPYHVKKIGLASFSKCNQIRYVKMHSGLEEIESYAFSDCENLINIIIPESVKKIGGGAFQRCKALNRVVVEGSIECLPDHMFWRCESLRECYLGSITEIGEAAFWYCRVLNKIELPETLEKIGNRAFSNCINLISINIPQSVKEIGEYAFEYCKSLNECHLSDSIKIIGDYTFSSCKALKRIELPKSLKIMGNYAFSYCGLEYLRLPKRLKEIGANALSDCQSLKKLSVHRSLDISQLKIPENCKVKRRLF